MLARGILGALALTAATYGEPAVPSTPGIRSEHGLPSPSHLSANQGRGQHGQGLPAHTVPPVKAERTSAFVPHRTRQAGLHEMPPPRASTNIVTAGPRARERHAKTSSATITFGNGSTGVVDANETTAPITQQPAGTCGCAGHQSVLVIVDSNMGSTWLGQLLHSHPCAHSFVPPGQRDDGHFRDPKYAGLVNQMKSQAKAAGGKSHGLMVPWNFLETYKGAMEKAPQAASYGAAQGPKILLMTREPIFQAISLLKKTALVKMKRAHEINCRNVNQRGDGTCDVAMSLHISPSFVELEGVTNTIAEHAKKKRLLARNAAELLRLNRVTGGAPPNFLELSYADLVCAQKMVGKGFLPPHVAEFLGLGTVCPTLLLSAHSSHKSSPGNSASSLSNLGAILKAADAAHKPWHEALLRPSEAWPCNSTQYPSGGRSGTDATDEVDDLGATESAAKLRHPLRSHRGEGNATSAREAEGATATAGSAEKERAGALPRH